MLPPTFLHDATFQSHETKTSRSSLTKRSGKKLRYLAGKVQELLITKPQGISRFRSWAEQKCTDRLLFSYHNEERRKGRIYRAANGAAEYRSHQDHCIVWCRDLEARDPSSSVACAAPPTKGDISSYHHDISGTVTAL